MKKGFKKIVVILLLVLGIAICQPFIKIPFLPASPFKNFHISLNIPDLIAFFGRVPKDDSSLSSISLEDSSFSSSVKKWSMVWQGKGSKNFDIQFPYTPSGYDLSDYGRLYDRKLDFPTANFPEYDQAPDRDKILEFASLLDGDYLFILQNTEPIRDFMEWWDKEDRLVDNFSTAIHEQSHVLMYGFDQIKRIISSTAPYHEVGGKIERYEAGMAVYLGEGEIIEIPMSSTFDSIRILEKIPESLYTFRLETYIKGNENMGSRMEGIYGLFNEYVAYYWDAKASLDVLKLYHDDIQHPTSDTILYWNGAFLPYAEFMYWMLTYLDYAKEYDPVVYQGVMENESFKYAFKTITQDFQKVCKELLTYTDCIITDQKESYDLLMQEINSKPLKSIYNELMS